MTPPNSQEVSDFPKRLTSSDRAGREFNSPPLERTCLNNACNLSVFYRCHYPIKSSAFFEGACATRFASQEMSLCLMNPRIFRQERPCSLGQTFGRLDNILHATIRHRRCPVSCARNLLQSMVSESFTQQRRILWRQLREHGLSEVTAPQSIF